MCHRFFCGSGLGSLLVERFIHEARGMGYLTIRLDPLPSIQGNAVALYRTFNFREILPYCYNPIPGAMFLELKISSNS